MAINDRVRAITFFQNPEGTNTRKGFDLNKDPVIVIEETSTKLVIRREGEEGFTHEYNAANIFKVEVDPKVRED